MYHSTPPVVELTTNRPNYFPLPVSLSLDKKTQQNTSVLALFRAGNPGEIASSIVGVALQDSRIRGCQCRGREQAWNVSLL